MRSWSIPVGRLFGVDVRLHLTFLILPMFVFWTEYAAHPGAANGPRDLALCGIILACVGIHECAHMIASRRVGLIPKAVILLPITGVALYEESRTEKQSAPFLWKREIWLALVGPLANLVVAAFAVVAITTSGAGVDLWKWPLLQASHLLKSVVAANLYIALLNLLPAYPLDGGRIVRALFSRTMDLSSATRRAVSISTAIALVFVFAGLFSDNWLTMVGVIVFSAAQLEERALVFQSVLDNVRLDEVMLTDFATLSPADTLEDALDKAVHSLQDDFPGRSRDGHGGSYFEGADSRRAARRRQRLRAGGDEQDLRSVRAPRLAQRRPSAN